MHAIYTGRCWTLPFYNLHVKERILFTRLLCSNDFNKSPPLLYICCPFFYNNLFNLHQMYQGKTEESEYITWGSTQVNVLRFHLCTPIPNFAQKQQFIFRINQSMPKANLWIINYCMLETKADNEPAISVLVYFKSVKKWKFVLRKKRHNKTKGQKQKTKEDATERTLRRRGCGITCNCGGIVRNDIW